MPWKIFHVEKWGQCDLNQTTGRILAISRDYETIDNIIDGDGIGADPLDSIQKGCNREDFKEFRNIPYSYDTDKFFANVRTKWAFKLKEMISLGYIALKDETLCQQLMELRYKYDNRGRKILISKEQMRSKGFSSPDLADSAIMCCSLILEVKEQQDNQYRPMQPQYYSDENPFASAGIR